MSDQAKKTEKSGKVTAEHKAEAALLRNIWDNKRDELVAAGSAVFTQESFGIDYGIGNQAAVGFFLNGKTALSPKAAAGFARGLGCQVGDFSPRLAKILETPPAETATMARLLLAGISGEGLRLAIAHDSIDEGGERESRFALALRVLEAGLEPIPGAPSPSPAPKSKRVAHQKRNDGKSRSGP